MPIYRLGSDLVFPHPSEGEPSGLLAVGRGSLGRTPRAGVLGGDLPLVLRRSADPVAFAGSAGGPASPDLHVPRSLAKVVRRERFEIRLDTAFAEVIRACAEVKRAGETGTWITPEMQQAYIALHEAGFAHSAEAFLDGRLVGGLYGVSLGSAFFGESMFAREPDASKVAFVGLVRQLEAWSFSLIDCQMHTAHLERFGSILWPRARFLAELSEAVARPTRRGVWRFDSADSRGVRGEES